jgi:hypothetical protein
MNDSSDFPRDAPGVTTAPFETIIAAANNYSTKVVSAELIFTHCERRCDGDSDYSIIASGA